MNKILICSFLLLLLIPIPSFAQKGVPHTIQMEDVRIMDKVTYNQIKIDVAYIIPNADPNGSYGLLADSLKIKNENGRMYSSNNELKETECMVLPTQINIKAHSNGTGIFTYCYSVEKGSNSFTLFRAPVAPDKEWIVIDRFAYDSYLKRIDTSTHQVGKIKDQNQKPTTYDLKIQNLLVIDKGTYNQINVDVVITKPDIEMGEKVGFNTALTVLKNEHDKIYYPENSRANENECKNTTKLMDMGYFTIDGKSGGTGSYTLCYSVEKKYHYFTLFSLDGNYPIESFGLDSNFQRVYEDGGNL